jgi:hypothetical protein
MSQDYTEPSKCVLGKDGAGTMDEFIFLTSWSITLHLHAAHRKVMSPQGGDGKKVFEM